MTRETGEPGFLTTNPSSAGYYSTLLTANQQQFQWNNIIGCSVGEVSLIHIKIQLYQMFLLGQILAGR